MYGRLPQDDDNYSLTHSQENLMSPSDDSDTFSPVDNMLHATNNNLDKQGNIVMICDFNIFLKQYIFYAIILYN